MRRRTVSMTELIEAYQRADRNGQMQDIGARRARMEEAVAVGRIVLLDQVMPGDPEGALIMGLVGSTCGHMIRVPFTKEDLAAIVGHARDEGVICA